MRTLAFAKRNALEILRDPLTLGFGLGFPLVLLTLLTAIQSRIPTPMFELETLLPGVAVFGLSFISLFSAQLVARDGATAFLARLLTTPMTATEFLLGYALPLLPMAVGQCGICCLAALCLGLPATPRLVLLCLANLPMTLVYVGLGLGLGSLLTEKQVGGICGALLTNLTAWLSGVWFDVELLGDGFARFAGWLPFLNGVELGRALLVGSDADVWLYIGWVVGWAAVCCTGAVLLFKKRLRG